MAPKGHRDQRIQILRGLAAMLVVVLHAQQTLVDLGRSSCALMRLIPNTGFGSMGVDLFFVISGVVMALAMDRAPDAASFLRARFIRVVPLFWLAAIMTIPVTVLLHEHYTFERVANSVTIFPLLDLGSLDTPLPPVGWTLAFELTFYLIVATALTLPAKFRFDFVLIVLMLDAAIGAAITPIAIPLLGVVFNPIVLEFALGMVLSRIVARPGVARIGVPLAIAGGVGLFCTIWRYPFYNSPEAVVSGLSSIPRLFVWGVPSVMLLGGLLARPERPRVAGPLVRLGDASYAIYLSHWLVKQLLPVAWPWTGSQGGDGLFVALVVGSGGVGLLAHRFVEQPLLRQIRKGRELSLPPLFSPSR